MANTELNNSEVNVLQHKNDSSGLSFLHQQNMDFNLTKSGRPIFILHSKNITF